MQLAEKIGGASRDRTDGLVVANDALSQLSYSPLGKFGRVILAAFPPNTKIRTRLPARCAGPAHNCVYLSAFSTSNS